MQWTALLRKKSGLTLIELMVALVICTLLVGAVYRTFINQGKTYTIQDNVVDMQQSARFAIDRMTREIRVAGFGGVARLLPVQFGAVTLNNIINPNTPVSGALSIVEAGTDAAFLTSVADPSDPEHKIIVKTLPTDSLGNPLFSRTNNTDPRRFLSIDGLECHEIDSIDSNTNTIKLVDKLLYRHEANTPVFAVRMITYQVVNQGIGKQLTRDDNTGQGSQPEADNIDAIQFVYYDATGNVTTAPNARMIQVSLTAKTPQSDPDFKGGDGHGHRIRNFSTYVQMKDIGLDQQQGGV